jgi:Cu/Zn superoxide dismutase
VSFLKINEEFYIFGLVTANLRGLTPGKHGVHIHEKAVEGCDCNSAGGHYNPTGEQHGGGHSVSLRLCTRKMF